MEGPEYSLTKTILEMDLVAYSDVARLLEENLNVEAVKAFQDQIQHFVDHGLEILDLKRDDIVMATAGDNAILMFDDAATMHKFAQAVQAHTLAHNASLSIDLAKRWFRMGAATGTILVIPAEHRIVGSTIARAVRLEAAAEIGQVVIDPPTFNSLPDELKKLYGAIETIKGKRSERFGAYRCSLMDISKTPVCDRLPFDFEDMGDQSVKNIARPVRAFAPRSEAIADLPVSGVPRALPIISQSAPRLSRLAYVFGCSAVAAVLWLAFRTDNLTDQQFQILRIVLALAGGGVGAVVPGILDLTLNAGTKLALRAGGALAVFVVLYFWSPVYLPPPPPPDAPTNPKPVDSRKFPDQIEVGICPGPKCPSPKAK